MLARVCPSAEGSAMVPETGVWLVDWCVGEVAALPPLVLLQVLEVGGAAPGHPQRHGGVQVLAEAEVQPLCVTCLVLLVLVPAGVPPRGPGRVLQLGVRVVLAPQAAGARAGDLHGQHGLYNIQTISDVYLLLARDKT